MANNSTPTPLALKGTRQKLPLQINGKKSGAGVDVFVARHSSLQNKVPHFDLDICFGSRHDAQMIRLFLQLRWVPDIRGAQPLTFKEKIYANKMLHV